jgi:cytochrome b
MINEVSKSTAGQTKTKLWVDILVFIAFLITMDPHSSGIAVHEWLSLAMIAAITVHLLLNWGWITGITSRFLGKVGGQNRINYIVNWLLFIDGTLIMISGIMISEVALPAFGIQLPIGSVWRRLHDMSANIGLLLLGVHVALHWSWIITIFNKYLIQPVVGLFPARQKKDASI